MKRSVLWTTILISLALVFASPFSQISAQTTSDKKGEKSEDKEATGEESKKEFPWDKGPATIDVSKYPEEQQANYKVFAQKCAKCHTLARAINSPYALPKEWGTYIDKMKKKKRSGLDAKSAKAIVNFVIYDSSVRKKDLIAKKSQGEGAAKAAKETKETKK